MLVYWIWFAQLKKLSCAQKWQILQHFHDPEEVYHCDEETFLQKGLPVQLMDALEDKDLTQARNILLECEDKGIHLLTIGDEEYPSRLRNTFDPPLVLYFKGTLPKWENCPAVGIVGTRKCSQYGCETAYRFGAEIAHCGALVVSGCADGIDAQAMFGALSAGKPVVGVLGTGVDVVYPKKNGQLFACVETSGCLISEYPPREEALAWHFPQRNRIISGICNGLLVVEAPEKSGALNTARHAYSQGRDMFVVPGNLGVDSCLGSNALLQEGAYPALSGWDVVKHYENLYPNVVAKRTVSLQKQISAPLSKVAQEPVVPQLQREKMETPPKKSIDKAENCTYSVLNKREVTLNREETAVLELLTAVPQYPDTIMDRSELPPSAVQSILTRLGIKGLVQYQPDGRISRK